jgi:hypothetical protein
MCARTGSSTIDPADFAETAAWVNVVVDVVVDVGADIGASAPFDRDLAIERLHAACSHTLSGSTRKRVRSNRFKSRRADAFDPRESIDRAEWAANRAIGDDARSKPWPNLREKREFADVGVIDINSMRMHDDARGGWSAAV